MRFRAFLSVAAVLFLAAGAALALPPDKPQQDMFPEVSTAEVKKMVDKKANFVLVDARSEEEYAEGHIKGAMNVPPEKLQFISGFLPKDKSIPVIFYCRGYG